jgi:hypothetical protein
LRSFIFQVAVTAVTPGRLWNQLARSPNLPQKHATLRVRFSRHPLPKKAGRGVPVDIDRAAKLIYNASFTV